MPDPAVRRQVVASVVGKLETALPFGPSDAPPTVRPAWIEGMSERFGFSVPQASVDGSKPAIYGHLKTGHFRRPETGVEYYFTASSVGKVESLPMTHEPEGGVVSNDT